MLLSVPHSGRAYPDWLVASAGGGLAALRSLEDPLVDRLAWRAIAAGHGAVIARAARAAIDCNRSPNDVDPLLIDGLPGGLCPTLRARSGLGIVPARTAGHGTLWRARLSRAEVERRIAEVHAPFHESLATGLCKLRDRHGSAILLDCHSMPSRRGQAQLVIGDRHGRSAAPWLAEEALGRARALGWSAVRNRPYSGGYVVERHGEPEQGVHALQLEIDRSCYLAADGTPGPGFDRAARLIAALADGLGRLAFGRPALAAE